jgi:hypothetical protein
MSMSRRRRPLEYYLLLGTLFLVALTAAILLAKPLTARQDKPKPNLDLRVADKDGRIREAADSITSANRMMSCLLSLCITTGAPVCKAAYAASRGLRRRLP